MTDAKPTLHLVLELHESQHDRGNGRTWVERLLIKAGLVPPYPEEETGAVWVVLPGRSSDDYQSVGIDLTGPVAASRARHVLKGLQSVFEQLGFAVVFETDYP